MAISDPVKISVRHLTKIFGDQPDRALQRAREGWNRERLMSETGHLLALSDVSFDVAEGEIFVIMGLSGSGKSTLIRCLNRLVEPTAGAILVDGRDITSFDAPELRNFRLRRIAMVFQHFALLPDRSVAQNVEFGLKLRGIPAAERRGVALEKLRQVGLESWADARPSQLSGGMQQRVGLARSLAVEPEILLMDEAFSALDPLIRAEMQSELLGLQRTLRRTIVFITHDLDEALALGNRVAILHEGKIVQIGTPQEILDVPADEHVSAFIRGVDRGKVFTAADAMRPCQTVAATVSMSDAVTAVDLDQSPIIVTDAEGCPLGILNVPATGSSTLKGLAADYLINNFGTVSVNTRLNELYSSFRTGIAMVVVDDSRRVVGSIEPGDILSRLSSKK